MHCSVYDLRTFYNGKQGRIVRRLLQEHIRDIWPDAHDLRVLGCGYATPYLRGFMQEAERVFALMPAGQGAHNWPQHAKNNDKNLVCLSEESELPFETNSIDRILLVHNLEFSELPQSGLQELWRVLKSNGRMIVVVPNRSGFWARVDWSPFGQGRPYSRSQILRYLKENQFIHEQTREALFMPPLKLAAFYRFARAFERFGSKVAPFMAGVHIVEVTKQLYAPSNINTGSKVRVRGRAFFPKPVPQGFRSDYRLIYPASPCMQWFQPNKK